MPLIRELDPGANPVAFFGAELRRARSAAGLSQEQLGQRIGYSGSLVGKIENGDRSPSHDCAKRCDTSLPAEGGLFLRVYELVRRWDGGYPSWFADWVEAERRATSLCYWEPLLVPGIVQTADYSRTLFEAWRQADGHEIDQLVNGRMERQSIFDRPDPPWVWVIVDEGALRRRIGNVTIMHEQLAHLAEMADRPKVTVQVVPAEAGAHVGLQGAFAIANVDSARTVYVEGPNQGQTTQMPDVLAIVSTHFDMLRAEALPRVSSRDIIRRVAEGQWTS